MARDWKPRQPPAKTSLTEIARRYHAAAVALAQTLGLSVPEVLSQHRESVTAIFIESGRCDLRLPAAVKLPPLGAPPERQISEPVRPSGDGQAGNPLAEGIPQGGNGTGRLPAEARLSPDQARELKRLAQTAFGYAEGERRLRADVGFEPDEKLTLRHLAAHVSAEQYERLRATYTARLQAAVEADVA
jgi:hypothetical protein